ncbi:hypothetical protein BH09BAC5_BH09BAC5_10380 [soil metagenome]
MSQIFRTSLFCISFLVLLIFSSCGMKSEGEKSDADKVGIENNLIKADSGDYEMRLPKEMYKLADLNDDASFQYADSSEELYVIVIHESKADFIKSFSDERLKENRYNDSISPEMNYRIVQLKSIQENMEMEKDPAISKMKINGLDAEIVDYTGTPENMTIPIFYKVGFVEGKKYIYMIMTWTIKEYTSTNNEKMDFMIRSFKLTDKK